MDRAGRSPGRSGPARAPFGGHGRGLGLDWGAGQTDSVVYVSGLGEQLDCAVWSGCWVVRGYTENGKRSLLLGAMIGASSRYKCQAGACVYD